MKYVTSMPNANSPIWSNSSQMAFSLTFQKYLTSQSQIPRETTPAETISSFCLDRLIATCMLTYLVTISAREFVERLTASCKVYTNYNNMVIRCQNNFNSEELSRNVQRFCLPPKVALFLQQQSRLKRIIELHTTLFYSTLINMIKIISDIILPNTVKSKYIFQPQPSLCVVCVWVCVHRCSVILLLALHLCLFTMIGMLLFAKSEVSSGLCH